MASLENEDVQCVFGIPGEETLDLNDALAASDIAFIPVRHEQGAAFMANVWGRLTQEAGVCLSTLGPGATNLLTGVADANLDRAPLVALSGQASRERMHKESHQYIDVVSLFRAVTKWNGRIQRADVIPEMVRKAFRLATSEKKGACHLELPEDVGAEEVDPSLRPLQRRWHPRAAPNPKEVERALAVLKAADYPLILAGNGVARGGAWTALRAFAERVGVPVATTFMGKGAMDPESELSLGAVGLQAHDYVLCGCDRADAILTVGYDPVEYGPQNWNPDRDKRIVHVDFTHSETDAYYETEVEVVGDVAVALEALTARADFRKDRAYTRRLRGWIQEALARGSASDAYPLKPQRVVHDLRRVLDPEDVLLSDVGAHKLWIARLFRTWRPHTCLISNGFASMGIALPGALAAKRALPDQKVLAAVGDGGFLMNVQELETATRLDLPIVVLVWRDGEYGVISWNQQVRFGRTAGTAFDNPDIPRLAEAFGCVGYEVTGADQLVPTLEEALAADVPAVVDCPVDYTENLRLTEELGQVVCPI